jgi:hypothetical protein
MVSGSAEALRDDGAGDDAEGTAEDASVSRRSRDERCSDWDLARSAGPGVAVRPVADRRGSPRLAGNRSSGRGPPCCVEIASVAVALEGTSQEAEVQPVASESKASADQRSRGEADDLCRGHGQTISAGQAAADRTGRSSPNPDAATTADSTEVLDGQAESAEPRPWGS